MIFDEMTIRQSDLSTKWRSAKLRFDEVAFDEMTHSQVPSTYDQTAKYPVYNALKFDIGQTTLFFFEIFYPLFHTIFREL